MKMSYTPEHPFTCIHLFLIRYSLQYCTDTVSPLVFCVLLPLGKVFAHQNYHCEEFISSCKGPSSIKHVKPQSKHSFLCVSLSFWNRDLFLWLIFFWQLCVFQCSSSEISKTVESSVASLERLGVFFYNPPV